MWQQFFKVTGKMLFFWLQVGDSQSYEENYGSFVNFLLHKSKSPSSIAEKSHKGTERLKNLADFS
jgi:hypothetical protein